MTFADRVNRPKLLEIEGSGQGDHLIIFEQRDDLQLYVDGEVIDIDVVRATSIIDTLEAWLNRKYAKPCPCKGNLLSKCMCKKIFTGPT